MADNEPLFIDPATMEALISDFRATSFGGPGFAGAWQSIASLAPGSGLADVGHGGADEALAIVAGLLVSLPEAIRGQVDTCANAYVLGVLDAVAADAPMPPAQLPGGGREPRATV
jgi:hypothetical protein